MEQVHIPLQPMLMTQIIVIVVAQATIAQEVVLVNNVHQESTRQQLQIQLSPTVVTAALAITAQEVVLDKHVDLVHIQ